MAKICGFHTIFNFLECLNFFDSDFISLFNNICRIPRPDSGGGRSDADDDGDDEDGRLVIDDVDRDHLTNLKENVLNLKSDKPRKKHLRFNGMPEEEVAKRLLPDLIKDNLDILIVSFVLI